jgi:group II intron reverse transcriptase/maturase
MSAASDLGRRVTLTSKTPTDNSMSEKHYWELASKTPQGCKQTILWLKLYCLNLVLWRQVFQFLCAVSFQLPVGCARDKPCSVLMMCTGQSRGFSKATMSSLNGTNGKPKGFNNMFYIKHGIRRIKETLGSPYAPTKREMSCFALVEGDRGPVVPISGRGPGKIDKNKQNAPVAGNLPSDSNRLHVPMRIKENWKRQESDYMGVKIPPKYVKILNISKNTKSIFDDLYPLLLTPEMYDLSYSRIKSNPGNMTPGINSETLSGWGPELISQIISKLANESFQFSKSRLVEMTKPQGGIRPLKVASPRDKVVQRIITDILEAIYEPMFSNNSYGFRPNLGCHDALYHIKQKYQATRWFIEGDIAKCFDSINHKILITILRRKIKDERFIRLIYKALRAGYLNSFKVPQDCIIGTPQGSIVSPILCNIIMNDFDSYVEQTLVPMYTKGKARQPSTYRKLMARSHYYGKKYKVSNAKLDLELSKKLRAEAQSLPSVNTHDPNFKRLYYTRYADDWLIGFAGPYQEAVDIRNLCKDYLKKLGLDLNLTKTFITKGSAGCIFLGTNIHVPLNEERFKKNVKMKSRANLGVRLNAPLSVIINKLSAAGYCKKDGSPTPRMALYASDKDEIVQIYSSIYRGILNYYSFADNYPRLALSMFSILRSSASKVLAAKLKLRSVRQVLLKYGKFLGRDKHSLPDYKTLSVRSRRFKRGKVRTPLKNLYIKASHTIRSQALVCSVCGSTYKVEMHHVRHLKDIKRNSNSILLAMNARRRKQIPLCTEHHIVMLILTNSTRYGFVPKMITNI